MAEGVTMLDPSQIPALPTQATPMPPPAINLPPQMAQGNRPFFGTPRFFVDPKRTANQDGTTSYKPVEYVEILTPGDKNMAPVHKVTPALIARYAVEYQLWKEQRVMSPSGTPLEMWPVLDTAMVHELKFNNIYTVEQLADIPDSNIHRIPMGHDWKNKARAWLEQKKDTDAMEKSLREKEALEASLKRQDDLIAAQNTKLAALEAALAATQHQEPPRRGPGRPPKTEAA